MRTANFISPYCRPPYRGIIGSTAWAGSGSGASRGAHAVLIRLGEEPSISTLCLSVSMSLFFSPAALPIVEPCYRPCQRFPACCWTPQRTLPTLPLIPAGRYERRPGMAVCRGFPRK